MKIVLVDPPFFFFVVAYKHCNYLRAQLLFLQLAFEKVGRPENFVSKSFLQLGEASCQVELVSVNVCAHSLIAINQNLN